MKKRLLIFLAAASSLVAAYEIVAEAMNTKKIVSCSEKAYKKETDLLRMDEAFARCDDDYYPSLKMWYARSQRPSGATKSVIDGPRQTTVTPQNSVGGEKISGVSGQPDSTLVDPLIVTADSKIRLQCGWTVLSTGSDQTSYIDYCKIREIDKFRLAWTLIDLNRPQIMPNGKKSQSIVMRDTYDCSKERSGVGTAVWYSGRMGEGVALDTLATPDAEITFNDVVPSSVGAATLMAVCDPRIFTLQNSK